MSAAVSSSVALVSTFTSASNRIMKSLAFHLWARWPGERQDFLNQITFGQKFVACLTLAAREAGVHIILVTLVETVPRDEGKYGFVVSQPTVLSSSCFTY